MLKVSKIMGIGALWFVAATVHGGALAQHARESGDPQVSGSATPEDKPSARSWWDSDIWSDGDRGFNWYPPERRSKPKRAETKKSDEKPVAVKPKNLREIRDLAELQAEIKRIKETAIFDPTPANVHRYLQANEYMLSQSQLFADVARRVVWQNPDVDYTAKSPQANYSLANESIRKTERREQVVQDIGRTHGLLYFYRSDCRFCADMSPVMKAMEARYGIEILAVSLDGKPTKDFPSPRRDNGISRFVSGGEGIQTVPAVYLVSNDKKTVTLLGTGALAMDEVAERVRVLTTTKPGAY